MYKERRLIYSLMFVFPTTLVLLNYFERFEILRQKVNSINMQTFHVVVEQEKQTTKGNVKFDFCIFMDEHRLQKMFVVFVPLCNLDAFKEF